MSRTDRLGLASQMIDVRRRAHPIDLPALRFHIAPTPRDVLEENVVAEFTRCGGYRANWRGSAVPVITAEVLVGNHARWKKDGRRSMMAVTNGVFTLRRASIKPEPAATLAWETEVERTAYRPTGWASAEPFALSLACDMGLREREGLPAYPNQAHLEAEEAAWQAGRARRCARGEQTICP